jgi:hypothetical protein
MTLSRSSLQMLMAAIARMLLSPKVFWQIWAKTKHRNVQYVMMLWRLQLSFLGVLTNREPLSTLNGLVLILNPHRCKDCILTHIATCEEKGQQPNCFACGRGPIKANELFEVVRKGPTNSQPSAAVVLRQNDFQSSTKLEALLRHLRKSALFKASQTAT